MNKPKQKILVDARTIGGEGQGVVTYLKGLYNAFHHRYGSEYELRFAGYDFQAMKGAFPFLEPRQFVPVRSRSRLQLFFREFPAILRREGCQFAHFQYMVPFSRACRFIVTTHDVLFNDFPADFGRWYILQRNWLCARGLWQSAVRLTVSEYSRMRIAHHYGIPKETIAVTPNAVPAVYFEPYSKEEAQQYIRRRYGIENFVLFVSRIEPRKNHQLLMKAYRELRLAERQIQLVFIGNDTLNTTSVVRQIKSLQEAFPGKFHWLSYVEGDDLLQFYRAARLFVYPSKAEGFGIPPLEAAAARVNTLCSNATAMGDFDFFGSNHFDPEDEGAFFRLLSENLRRLPDPRRLQTIAQTIRQRYSWEAAAEVLHSELLRVQGATQPVVPINALPATQEV